MGFDGENQICLVPATLQLQDRKILMQQGTARQKMMQPVNPV
jgi:hypothetical protein